jgi:hypothetical protein
MRVSKPNRLRGACCQVASQRPPASAAAHAMRVQQHGALAEARHCATSAWHGGQRRGLRRSSSCTRQSSRRAAWLRAAQPRARYARAPACDGNGIAKVQPATADGSMQRTASGEPQRGVPHTRTQALSTKPPRRLRACRMPKPVVHAALQRERCMARLRR